MFGDIFLMALTMPRFYRADVIVQILAFAIVLEAMSTITQLGILVERKTHLLAIISWIVNGILVILLLMLVPKYGAIGAAIAFLVSRFLMLVSEYALACKVSDIRLPVLRGLIPLMLASLFVVMATSIPAGTAGGVASRVAATLALTAAVIFGPGLLHDERRAIFTTIHSSWSNWKFRVPGLKH